MTDQRTKQLIKLYQKTKSQRAFEVLVKNHQNAIYYTVNHLHLNERDEFALEKDDFIQLGQEVLWKCLKDFNWRKEIKFNTYFINIFKFRIIDYIRVIEKTRQKTRKMSDVPETPYHDEAFRNIEDKELIEKLNKIILKLDPIERVVLLHKYYGGKIFELAQQLGVSGARVSQIYTGALKKLRDKLTNDQL